MVEDKCKKTKWLEFERCQDYVVSGSMLVSGSCIGIFMIRLERLNQTATVNFEASLWRGTSHAGASALVAFHGSNVGPFPNEQ